MEEVKAKTLSDNGLFTLQHLLKLEDDCEI